MTDEQLNKLIRAIDIERKHICTRISWIAFFVCLFFVIFFMAGYDFIVDSLRDFVLSFVTSVIGE